MGKVAQLRPYTIAADFTPGSDAYVPDPGRYIPRSSRWWAFGGVPRTVQLDTGEYVKSWSGFRGATVEEMRATIEEIRSVAGISLPTGYADAFRAGYRTPRVSASFGMGMLPFFRGGWQQAIRTGQLDGAWTLYDLRQAYLWSLTEGLPDPRYFHRTRCLTYRDAVYLVRLARVEPDAPYPFNQETRVIATGEEIGYYGLDVEECLDGVAFKRSIPIEPMLSSITRWSFWKQVARAYWGAWASRSAVECHTRSKSWELPPMSSNVIWAHLIVSRVKRRVFDQAGGAAHVFVDSVLTRREIRTGDNIGDWRVAQRYPDGIRVQQTGAFGPKWGALDKYAGVARESPLRQYSGEQGGT
jgi:hypothetical protein